MNKSILVKFDWFFLIGICLFTFAILIFAAQPWGDNYAYSKFSDYFKLTGMILWSISPYLAMFIALLVFSKKKVLIKTFSVCIFVISLFAGLILFDTMFIHIDAQGGLVFLFLPIYQWLAFFVLLLICAIVYKFSGKALNKRVQGTADARRP